MNKRFMVLLAAATLPGAMAKGVTESFLNGVTNDFMTGTYVGTQATTLEVITGNANDSANNGGSTVLRTQASSGNRFRIIMRFDLSTITPYASQITISSVGLELTQAISNAGDATTYPLVANTFNGHNSGWLQGSGTGTLASTIGPWATGSDYAAAYTASGVTIPAVTWKNTDGSSSGLLSGGGTTTGPIQSLYNQTTNDANAYVGGNAVGTHYTETDSSGKFLTTLKNWVNTPSSNAGLFFSNGGTSTTPVEFFNDNTATLANRPGLQLSISSPTMSTDWINDGSDVWSNSSDWDNGSPNTIGSTVNFGNTITAPRMVTVDGPKVVSSLNFDSTSGYTLSGSNAITLLEVNNGQANINVNSGSHAISTPLIFDTNTNISVASGSSLEIDGPVSAGAKIMNVPGPGTVVLGSTSVLNSLAGIGGGTLNVNGGVVAVKPHSAGAGSAASPVALNFGGGTLDLGNNDLIFSYTGANDPSSTIRPELQSAYNNGAWNGSGIGTSLASSTEGLGYGQATDVGIPNFDGNAVTTAVLVKYTYYGDSSLDGKVDLGNDFNLFLQGFLNPDLITSSNAWEYGDYNYDNNVDMNDFALFVKGYAGQGGSLGDLEQVIAGSGELSSGQRAALLSVVPEPASLSACAALAAVTALRRRRKQA